jgi:hypothetical protein
MTSFRNGASSPSRPAIRLPTGESIRDVGRRLRPQVKQPKRTSGDRLL